MCWESSTASFTLYVFYSFVMPYSETESPTGMPLRTDASIEVLGPTSFSSAFVLSFISVSV